MTLSCHIIIGCPSRKKSKLTKAIVQEQPDHYMISVAQIREQLDHQKETSSELYLSIEENEELEAEVYRQIDDSLKQEVPIIYDAINARRPERMQLLANLREKYPEVNWIGWYSKLSREKVLAETPKKNQDKVERIYDSLQKFDPIPAEGFDAVHSFTLKDLEQKEVFLKQEVAKKIEKFPQTLINRNNRVKSSPKHRYSQLIDFERLMYLIRIIIENPGIGDFHNKNSGQIKEFLGEEKTFASDIDEIATFIAKIAHPIYADRSALENDLRWLEKNGLIGKNSGNCELDLENQEDWNIPTHGYSKVEKFYRLIKEIRLIIHHPFIRKPNQASQESFVFRLLEEGLIKENHHKFIAKEKDQEEEKEIIKELKIKVRKDIEDVLKPYGILPNISLKQGYFAGAAILSKEELVKIFRLLETQAESLDDPNFQTAYQMFKERIEWLESENDPPQSYAYPVRTIHNRDIVDVETVSDYALSRKIRELEEAIERGQLLELTRIKEAPSYQREPNNYFRAYPLQLIFHNIGWYLGFEHDEGEQKGLFQFERVDRLFRGRDIKKRSLDEQRSSLKQLERLRKSSAGIYLGKDVQKQQQYLSSKKSEREKAEATVELWFNDAMFRFISEGTNRFPVAQMKMSKSFDTRLNRENPGLFSLEETGDSKFPHRYQVKLPRWCVEDYDFHRWILGFGGQVKVIAPEALKQVIKDKGNAIAQVYADD